MYFFGIVLNSEFISTFNGWKDELGFLSMWIETKRVGQTNETVDPTLPVTNLYTT